MTDDRRAPRHASWEPGSGPADPDRTSPAPRHAADTERPAWDRSASARTEPQDWQAENDTYRPGAAPEPEPAVPGEARSSGLARVREYVLVAVIALTLSFLVKTFLVQPFYVPSGSMENTLVPGDRIVVNKLPGSTDNLQRGDVVVFEDPDRWLPPVPQSGGVRGAIKTGMQFVGLYPAGDQHLVKRVIGIGGDHVVCCDRNGRISINGTAINETYLRTGEKPSIERFDIRVPQGKLWMMGDNRSGSGDSREHDAASGGRVGSVPESKATGKLFSIVWPIGRFGQIDDAASVFSGVPKP